MSWQGAVLEFVDNTGGVVGEVVGGASVKMYVQIFYPQEKVARWELGSHGRNTDRTVYPCTFGSFLKVFESYNYTRIRGLLQIKRYVCNMTSNKKA